MSESESTLPFFTLPRIVVFDPPAFLDRSILSGLLVLQQHRLRANDGHHLEAQAS
jgi:hypothetical protein